MDETVLVYIFKNDEVLMLLRNKKKVDINKGKWMGVGGHLEKGESKEDALFREVKEETNLDIIDYKFLATLYFYNNEYKEKMYLYRVDKFEGELIECNEGDLKFVKVKDLLNLNMWEGDKIFIKKMLDNDPYYEMSLSYEGDRLLKAELL